MSLALSSTSYATLSYLIDMYVQLKECAQQPGLAAATAASGCSPTNWTCICSSPAFLVDAPKYEEQYCSVAERQGKPRDLLQANSSEVKITTRDKI